MFFGCQIVCVLGLILAIQLVYFYIVEMITDPTSAYRKSLNDEQKKMYDTIVVNRRNLFRTGLMYGAVLSVLWIGLEYYLYKKVSIMRSVCILLAGSLATSNVYYSLSPKGPHMLEHLDTNERILGWLDVYNTMKRNYILGGLLGIIIAVGLSYKKVLTCK